MEIDSLWGDEGQIFTAFEAVFGDLWLPKNSQQAWDDINRWTEAVKHLGYHFAVDVDEQTVYILDADGEIADAGEQILQDALNEAFQRTE